MKGALDRVNIALAWLSLFGVFGGLAVLVVGLPGAAAVARWFGVG